ncbi:MAG: hypothetical protein JW995_03425 [Melioribacteraceae bacterium]|nr:hypothetical protein [Melioribacteraceae bacterium]
MKKGCILKSIFIFVIVGGSVVYIVREYGRGFYESSKEKFVSSVLNEIEDQMERISAHSLDTQLYNSIMNRIKDIKDSKVDDVKLQMKLLFGDVETLVSLSNEKIKENELLKNTIRKYEGRKENRN